MAELAVARAECTYRKVIKQYKQVKLLIMDEWLLYPLKDAEAHDLLEITEARYKKAATIFCSQFEVGGWHHKIGKPTLVDAICDRIVHDPYTIVNWWQGFYAQTERFKKRGLRAKDYAHKAAYGGMSLSLWFSGKSGAY